MAGGADNIVTIYYQKGRTVVLDYSLGNLDTLTTTLFIHFPWEIIISVALLVSKKNHNRWFERENRKLFKAWKRWKSFIIGYFRVDRAKETIKNLSSPENCFVRSYFKRDYCKKYLISQLSYSNSNLDDVLYSSLVIIFLYEQNHAMNCQNDEDFWAALLPAISMHANVHPLSNSLALMQEAFRVTVDKGFL